MMKMEIDFFELREFLDKHQHADAIQVLLFGTDPNRAVVDIGEFVENTAIHPRYRLDHIEEWILEHVDIAGVEINILSDHNESYEEKAVFGDTRAWESNQ